MTLNEHENYGRGVKFEHTFSGGNYRDLRNITVNGDNITKVDLSFTGLHKLDVSKNTELKVLIFEFCGFSSIINLDLSKNTELTYLKCFLPWMPEFDKWDSLYGSLHNNNIPGETKTIIINKNKGDRSISERKGWTLKFLNQ